MTPTEELMGFMNPWAPNLTKEDRKYVNELLAQITDSKDLSRLLKRADEIGETEISQIVQKRVERRGMSEVGQQKGMPPDMWKQMTKDFVGRSRKRRKTNRKRRTARRDT